MQPGRRSRTAEATAALRAIHQSFDSEPLILEDPFAARFLTPVARLALTPLPGAKGRLERFVFRRLRKYGMARAAIGSRRIRAQVLVRSRYAEDQLEALIPGVDQFVILAAGLDSFALRRTDLGDRLRVFELDHPDTQRWKSDQLLSLRIDRPKNLELVPCDFETQSLAEALSDSGYDPHKPTFFSWLGVSYYLSIEAIRETLLFLATQAPGSHAVFDYWTTGADTGPADSALLSSIRASVAAQGERMLSFFGPAEMAELIKSSGLHLLEDVSAKEADGRYLDGRPDGLRMPGFAHLVSLQSR